MDSGEDDGRKAKPPGRSFFERLKEHPLARVGPGLITGVADDDPSGIATYSQAGAQFGYNLGWILVISGVVGLATTLSMYRAPGFWWSVVSAATAIAAGLALSGWPLHVTLPIERVLVYFFVIEGIVSIIYAFDHKRAMSGRWAWMLACGLVDLALGGVILAGLAGAAERTTGTLVGISMLFGGVSLIAMALDARAIGR